MINGALVSVGHRLSLKLPMQPDQPMGGRQFDSGVKRLFATPLPRHGFACPSWRGEP